MSSSSGAVMISEWLLFLLRGGSSVIDGDSPRMCRLFLGDDCGRWMLLNLTIWNKNRHLLL